jgi:hypothetical protein
MPDPKDGDQQPGAPQRPQAPLPPAVPLGNAPALVAAAKVRPPAPQPFQPQAILTSGVPQLPALPNRAWAAAPNPNAQHVQRQYVDQRIEELDAQYPKDKRATFLVIREYLKNTLNLGKIAYVRGSELERVYLEIERNLQSAALTVNFQAPSWFMQPNPYDTYTQMYERAVANGQMVLKSVGSNRADARAEIDNQVTFPDAWNKVKSSAQRGLAPGRQSPDRIMNQMNTGQMINRGDDTFLAANKNFNPVAKQVFLALNYGRRPHGAATQYGMSYFILKSDLKTRCMYYGGDTFNHYKSTAHAGQVQVPYYNLATVLGKSQKKLQKAIFESCYEGRTQADLSGINGPDYLLEAHHFGELNFREHVERLVVTPEGRETPEEWAAILANAQAFAQRLGIAIYRG